MAVPLRPGPENELTARADPGDKKPAPHTRVPCEFAHEQQGRPNDKVLVTCDWLTQRMGERIGVYNGICEKCMREGQPKNGHAILEVLLTTQLRARLEFGNHPNFYGHLPLSASLDYLQARGADRTSALRTLLLSLRRDTLASENLTRLMEHPLLSSVSTADRQEALLRAVREFGVEATKANEMRTALGV